MAADEQQDETESAEDVELHGRRRTAMASDEPVGEAESDDDVELHASKSRKAM